VNPAGAQRPPGASLIVALGIVQIVGWGSIFYSFGFLMAPMQEALGLGRGAVGGAFSVALLCSGLLAPRVGATIDRVGGRRLMTAGSLAVAVLLFALSRAESAPALYLIYAGLGAAMACTLYEPTFVVLTHAFRANPRRAITLVTLFGGLAGTIFWPLTQALIGWLGWRDTLLVLAGLNLLVSAPLHALLVPDLGAEGPAASSAGAPSAGAGTAAMPATAAAAASPSPAPSEAAPEAVRKDPLFKALRLSFIGHALLFSTLSAHLMALLQAKGLSTSDAALIGAMIGPMQVVGRLLELGWGRRLPILNLGVIAICTLPLALLLLWSMPAGTAFWILALFALPYGLGNGLITIVRGSAVVELWGRSHYGRIQGAIARPVLAATATGPLAASLLWELLGDYDHVLLVLIGVAAVAAVTLVRAARQRHRAAAR
jgi:MFS family permease